MQLRRRRGAPVFPGSALDEEHQIVILKELAAFFSEYEAMHGIRSRRSGGRFFIEIFLKFSPEKPLGQVQEVIDKMRKGIEGKISGSSITIGLNKEDVKLKVEY